MRLFVTQVSCFSAFEHQVWFGLVRNYHGCAICGQCVISVLLASYYHRYDEDEYWNELRYGSQYYGDAYYIALAGLVLSAITLASLLGEESQAVNYMVSYLFDLR